jgi:hypothetical protein
MQKVVGSNPISRFAKGLHLQAFSAQAVRYVRLRYRTMIGQSSLWRSKESVGRGLFADDDRERSPEAAAVRTEPGVRVEPALLTRRELPVDVVGYVALRPSVVAAVSHVAHESHRRWLDPRTGGLDSGERRAESSRRR